MQIFKLGIVNTHCNYPQVIFYTYVKYFNLVFLSFTFKIYYSLVFIFAKFLYVYKNIMERV